MTTALIGHTGFVGGNLRAQARFDEFYNSANIASIAGKSFELVVSAGAPAAKWIANQKPDEDRAAIQRLMDALGSVTAKRFCLISSVDVYPRPIDVDETTPIDAQQCQPYGKHRLELEAFVARRFPGAQIVRLPGLFGLGIKKNVIFDFLNDNRLDLVHQGGVFQFYDLKHLWRDVQLASKAALGVVNFATEPTSVQDVAREAFGRSFTNTLSSPAPRYDFKTVHAAAFGKAGSYLYSRTEVLADMKAFVKSMQAARS